MLLNRTLFMQLIYSGSGLPDDTSSVQELMASSLLVVRSSIERRSYNIVSFEGDEVFNFRVKLRLHQPR